MTTETLTQTTPRLGLIEYELEEFWLDAPDPDRWKERPGPEDQPLVVFSISQEQELQRETLRRIAPLLSEAAISDLANSLAKYSPAMAHDIEETIYSDSLMMSVSARDYSNV